MKIAVVCLGNICRTPIAAAVLRRAIDEAGLADRIELTSAGTADYHIGKPADERTRAVLVARGYDDTHTARQFTAADLREHDLVLAMDASNRENLRALSDDPAEQAKVVLFRSFDPSAPEDAEVPDPYYDGRFDEAADLIEATVPSIVDHLRTLV